MVTTKEYPPLFIHIRALNEEKTTKKKIQYLQNLPEVNEKLPLFPEDWIKGLTQDNLFVLLSFLAISPKEQIEDLPKSSEDKPKFLNFLEDLKIIEHFYESIGGILGYEYEIFKLLQPPDEYALKDVKFEHPPGWSISQEDPEQIYAGLYSLPLLAEIYPVGGAGDRLDLRDEESGEPLPVACLPFLGKNLIELMIDDLQGREYLFYKMFNQQICTPIALMTSVEKNNHQHIKNLLEKSDWYGRPLNTFMLVKQPLAPLVNLEGTWILGNQWELKKKPGGHGVIWKLARDEGVFDWFFSQHRSKGIIRQLNNPIAGIDHALLSFAGVGTTLEKKFGFLSCERTVNSQEGMDVLYLEKTSHGYVAGIVNIEYTDFVRKKVEDVPKEEGSPYSAFPSNTNILFADLEQVNLAAKTNPLPGLVFNPKTKVEKMEMPAGRLESAMQNIADDFKDLLAKPLYKDDWKNLSVFIAYNDRKKTISVAKKAYVESGSTFETPIGAYNDLLQANIELLRECGVDVPKYEEIDIRQPPLIFHYLPSLGPIYSVIRQKISQGKIVQGGELMLEIAEFYWNKCTLLGSLIIEAKNPLGREQTHFSNACGKCYLEHVAIKNKGIDYSKENHFWKRKIHRRESLRIILEGNSFFYAKDVVIEGDKEIVVQDGKMVIAKTQDGQMVLEERDLKKELPLFNYKFNQNRQIQVGLEKEILP